MNGWMKPAELRQPLPRRTRPSMLFKTSLVFPAALYVAIVAFIAVPVSYPLLHKMEVLKARGVETEATVIGLHVRQHKSALFYDVNYGYRLKSPATGTLYEATDGTSSAIYRELQIGKAVPIVYDPSAPTQSALNFEDRVHTDNDYKTLEFLLAIMFVPTLLLYACLLPSWLSTFYREKSLLTGGRPAAATIVDEQEYWSGSRVRTRLACVTYRFTDAQGRAVEGIRKGLPTKSSRRREKFRAMFENPTVVYDAQDSSKNLLYPASLVDCVAP